MSQDVLLRIQAIQEELEALKKGLEMKDLLLLVAGFILGIIGSYIWWRYLLTIKPEVKISSVVLKGFSYIDLEEVVYRIKLINFGNRQVIDIKAEAWIIERRNHRWSPVSQLKLVYDGELMALGSHGDYGDILKKISPVFYMNIKAEQNFEANLNEDRMLAFTLSAKDALSGTAVVQRQVYSKKDIQEGDFKPGFTFDIR